MSFSMQRILDFLDSQPERDVMNEVAIQYQLGRRGLFSEKFIPFIDIQTTGYRGLRSTLVSLYELDPDFVEFNKQELYVIVRNLKGEQDGS